MALAEQVKKGNGRFLCRMCRLLHAAEVRTAGPAAAVHKDRQGNAAMNNNQNQIVNNLVKSSSRFGCAGNVSATEKQKSTGLRNASLMT